MEDILAAVDGVKFPAWSEIFNFNAYSNEFQGFKDWLGWDGNYTSIYGHARIRPNCTITKHYQ
jgi:hypothetical protein